MVTRIALSFTKPFRFLGYERIVLLLVFQNICFQLHVEVDCSNCRWHKAFQSPWLLPTQASSNFLRLSLTNSMLSKFANNFPLNIVDLKESVDHESDLPSEIPLCLYLFGQLNMFLEHSVHDLHWASRTLGIVGIA